MTDDALFMVPGRTRTGFDQWFSFPPGQAPAVWKQNMLNLMRSFHLPSSICITSSTANFIFYVC
jgi:antibiotic biosynthesis monooxygenase (ABM) superfamily enzyme